MPAHDPLPFFRQELRGQPGSHLHRNNSTSDMPFQALPQLPASLARSAWHELNEELTQNVEREFPAYRTQAEAYYEDVLRPMGRVTPLPRDFFDLQHEPSDRGGYMQRSSPFSLDSPQVEMSFIDWFPKGDAVITYLNDVGEIVSIPNLNTSFFEERCPLLAHAFEHSRSGPKLYLEILTPTTALPFVRYLYTASYAVPGAAGDIYEDVPTSVLLHCQLFRLGDIYDLPDLRQQAYVNITRQCEFGCSSPDKPIDLCEAIQYAYEHLSEHTNLIETIVCYCVTCFLKHRLDEDFEFRTMAFDLRPFQQDLVRECMKREFEDDTASAIINLPFKPYVPETYASREDITADRCTDVVYHFHASDDYDSSSKKRKREGMASSGPGLSAIALALRQKREQQNGLIQLEEPASDLEDLGIGTSKRRASMVRRDSASSESEFELVAGPASVEELTSESDSDSDALVVVENPAGLQDNQQRSLPIRRRSVASSITLVNPANVNADGDSGSESDWTVV